MNDDTEHRVGLLVFGEEPNRSVHFGLCLGIEPEAERKLVSTAAGAPEASYFTNADAEDPNEARRILIDVKQVMRESDRGFYVHQIETALEKFWEKHGSELCRKLLEDGSEAELEEFFIDRFLDRSLLSLSVSLVEFDAIDFGTHQESSPEPEEGSDESNTTDRQSSGRSPYPVRPVIDVREGEPVEALQPGTKISVKLAGDVAQQVGERVKGDPLAELPPLPAEVLSVDDESSSEYRTVIVQLQDDIYGVGKVTPGSQIETVQPPEPAGSPRDEESLRVLVVLILIWLVLMATFTYLVIL